MDPVRLAWEPQRAGGHVTGRACESPIYAGSRARLLLAQAEQATDELAH